MTAQPAPDERTITVALTGNPNCGKTTLSNTLTGSNDSVGNYPRVTVEKKERVVNHRGWTIRVVDLPGIYALTSQSPEERIGRDFIHHEQPDIVVNVLDAGNLDRSLFLTTQLIEMGCPRVYAFNMMDEARAKGININVNDLTSMLGGKVVETAGITGEGCMELLDAVVETAEAMNGESTSLTLPYDSHLEDAIGRVQQLVTELHPKTMNEIQTRWLSIKLLEGDEEIIRHEDDHERLIELLGRERQNLANTHGEDSEAMFANARYGFIHGLLMESRTINPAPTQDLTHKIDDVMLHQYMGMPVFLGLMWLMFEATFTLGQYPMDWIDAGVAWVSGQVSGVLSPGMFRDVMVDGIIAGVGGTIVFLPNIVILFFFMALFSETGYLARSAFLLDRVMHKFGLHGKAFIPLVMGFGCNVPAVMACRTIESPRARLVAILINPFMSCTARLPVFILFAGAFFSHMAGTVVFAMYMLSIIVAMGVAVFLSKCVVRGGYEPFVMELPPYRIPTLRAVILHMWEKALKFLQKVAGIILVGSIVLWTLQAFPRDVDMSMDYDAGIAQLETQIESPERDERISLMQRARAQESLEKSYLGRIGLAVTPVFEPLGFGWKDTIAILTGLLAKEVVIASYAVIYAQDEGSTEYSKGLQASLSGTMTPLVAFAFMVFVLLYCPCLSTIAAIRHETNSWRWAGFSVVFSMCLAWILALGVVTVGGLMA
ncbi:MAG: ferrous iron transport protein B [Alphaproteobacteria bacterium]|nr:ferrous iron transport protein B [Alphaproteobacteria bacterium]